MRVFVAGATGALGIPLVRRLVAAGHEVTGLTRSAAKRPSIEKLGARAVVADALNAAAIEEAILDGKPDAVVHALTALPRGGPRRARDLVATNELRTRGTRNLIKAAIAAGARRFIAESIVFAYGWRVESNTPVDETSPRPARVARMLQPALDAIVALETQTLGASPLEGIVLRYGLVYGAGSGSTEEMIAMLRARRLPAFGAADSAVPWIHIEDAALVTVLAIERGAPGSIYNVTDDAPVGFADFLREAARIAGAPSPRDLPLWLVRLLMPYAGSIGAVRLRVSNAKAKRELGWAPKYPSYREGLAALQ
jgi:nucleoside-diphosphate-sugar epimerase